MTQPHHSLFSFQLRDHQLDFLEQRIVWLLRDYLSGFASRSFECWSEFGHFYGGFDSSLVRLVDLSKTLERCQPLAKHLSSASHFFDLCIRSSLVIDSQIGVFLGKLFLAIDGVHYVFVDCYYVEPLKSFGNFLLSCTTTLLLLLISASYRDHLHNGERCFY